MSNKPPPSLREQMIRRLVEYGIANVDIDPWKLFDEAIMPILQKAMDAGQLLVSRNTQDRVPVDKSIIEWLEKICEHVTLLQENEAVISKKQCLKVIYQFGTEAEKALFEAKRHNDMIKKEIIDGKIYQRGSFKINNQIFK
jgi:hypothetical protein